MVGCGREESLEVEGLRLDMVYCTVRIVLYVRDTCIHSTTT